MKKTLLEFWSEQCDSLTTVFVAGFGCPAGETYRQSLEDEGEDYCDLRELIDSGLFSIKETGESSAWEAEGEVTAEGWEWNGIPKLTDSRGNNYYQFRVF